ncbi:MAG: 50S ribosomal protein L1 [Gammaproteobacteria bacterium]
MSRLGKRTRAARERLPFGKPYAVEEGLLKLKETATAKFDETVDLAVNLGIDARKTDQAVRGATVLPNGTGKRVRVAVFADGAKAEAARAAGADVVGLQDLAQQVKSGQMDFDVVIAAPESMGVVGQLGPILGPRGLMPNPKVGTVAADVAMAVKNAKSGQVRFKSDKGGIIHCSIGKASFEVRALKENLEAVIAALNKAKPSTAKGVYLKKITVSSTMGPGVVLDRAPIA